MIGPGWVLRREKLKSIGAPQMAPAVPRLRTTICSAFALANRAPMLRQSTRAIPLSLSTARLELYEHIRRISRPALDCTGLAAFRSSDQNGSAAGGIAPIPIVFVSESHQPAKLSASGKVADTEDRPNGSRDVI